MLVILANAFFTPSHHLTPMATLLGLKGHREYYYSSQRPPKLLVLKDINIDRVKLDLHVISFPPQP